MMTARNAYLLISSLILGISLPIWSLASPSTVHVSSTRELFKAIASDRVIVCKPGNYYIRDAYDITTKNLVWDRSASEPIIRDIRNLTILAPHGMQLLNERRSGYVLTLSNAGSVRLTGLTLGHVDGVQDCYGGVLRIINSGDIIIRESTLFGSGITGIEAVRTRGVILEDCVIRDCTRNILDLEESHDWAFRHCTFSGTVSNKRAYLCRFTKTENILFSGCTFTGNATIDRFFSFDRHTSRTTLRQCRFRGNRYARYSDHATLPERIGCTFRDTIIPKSR